MKKIGILGGVSLASTIAYYRTITDLYYERFGDYYYPEIILYSLDFGAFTDMENEGRMDDYKAYILDGIRALHRAGADFVAMAANSPHSVLEDIRASLPVPVVSIVESVVRKASALGLESVLLTGIKYTMQADFYPKGFEKAGIRMTVPSEADQDSMNGMIFDELVLGVIKDSTRERLKEIIHAYDTQGVLLGCTELPLLLSQKDTGRALLDSMAIHCQDILDLALRTDQ